MNSSPIKLTAFYVHIYYPSHQILTFFSLNFLFFISFYFLSLHQHIISNATHAQCTSHVIFMPCHIVSFLSRYHRVDETALSFFNALWLCSFKGSRDAGLNQRRTRYNYIYQLSLSFRLNWNFWNWWWKSILKIDEKLTIFLHFLLFFRKTFLCLLRDLACFCVMLLHPPPHQHHVKHISRISPMRDGQTPDRDRLPHYGPRFTDR